MRAHVFTGSLVVKGLRIMHEVVDRRFVKGNPANHQTRIMGSRC